jgi:hypothetical protein
MKYGFLDIPFTKEVQPYVGIRPAVISKQVKVGNIRQRSREVKPAKIKKRGGGGGVRTFQRRIY